MRLSATDRIIRESEQHDSAAVEAADHPDTEKVSALPFAALGIPVPRMPPPLEDGVDIDLDDGEAGQNAGQDEEGETQVDAKRSAAALKEMRALEAVKHAPPPAITGTRSLRPRGVPPGRPGGTAVTPAPVLLSVAPVALVAATDDDRPDHLFTSTRIQFGAIAQPPPLAADAMPVFEPRRVGRVSRRTGILIAASTALAVALIAGAWTAKNPPAEDPISDQPPPVLPSSLLPGANAATPPRPTVHPTSAPVVVATPPATATAPEPEEAEAPPGATAPELVPPPATTTEAAPLPATAPPRSAPLSKRAQAAAGKKAAAKARIVKKRAALAAAVARRKTGAHKAAKSVAAPAPRARPASTPAIATPSRGRGDPDDTLPITD